MALRETLESAERVLESDRFGLPRPLISIGLASWLLVGVVIALLIGAWGIVLSASISIPLILATVVGAISYPTAQRLRDRGWSDTASALAVLAALLTIIVLTVWIVIAGIVAQWPSLVAGAEEGINQLVATLEGYGWNAQALRTAAEQALKTGDPATSALSGVLSGIVSSLAGGLSGIFGFFFGVFVSVTLLYYILHDFDEMRAWVGSHIGLPQDLGEGVIEDAIGSLRGYFRGTTYTGIAVALVIAFGTWALGVPLAVPIGLVTFVTCYIPFFGAIFSGAFAFFVALGAGGFSKAVALLIIVLVAQNVLQTVISSRFLGESLSLHAIVVLVVTMLGGTFGGLLGAALAAPITALGVRAVTRMKAYRPAAHHARLEDSPEALGG